MATTRIIRRNAKPVAPPAGVSAWAKGSAKALTPSQVAGQSVLVKILSDTELA